MNLRSRMAGKVQTVMQHRFSRGTALITAMTVLFVVFVTGSGILSLSVQAMRRGRLDALRVRALALAEAGAEKAILYLRTTAPNNSTDGSWRTAGMTETVADDGEYQIVVQDGTGENAGKIIVTSTGRAHDGSLLEVRRAIRVAIKLEREDISIWNNAIFGGVGQSGKSINGNVRIRGGVHLLGDGEPFTDLDSDQRWDSGEPYTDKNANNTYDIGEPYTDTDGDGHRDPREQFDDINGNGTRDPALTVTDLSSEFSGDANVGNNYTGMPVALKSLLPALPTTGYGGDLVDTIRAKLRVKHGRVNISGTASVGDPNVVGGSPPVKETMDGTYVSDGYGGNKGATQVYSDNGTKFKYNLGNMVDFPTLTSPVVKDGVQYSTYMEYLTTVGLVVTGNVTLTPGTAYGPKVDAKGNMLYVDASGNMTIKGIVYVAGDIKLARKNGDDDDDEAGGGFRYSGRGTLVSTGNIYVSSDVLPSTPTFPVNHAIGFIARRRIELATGNGDSHLTLSGAFYAQEQIRSVKQNELAGTFVSSYYSMQNVPHMYQVPALPDYLPPGMPGAGRVWIKNIRLDSWREVRV
jgi:hypothetical protein